VPYNILRELYGPRAIEVDHHQLCFKIGLGKEAANADSGVDTSDVKLSACRLDLAPKSRYALSGCQIGLRFDDSNAGLPKFASRCIESLAGRTDDEVITAAGQLLR
jgi:hypothetical protein